MKAPGFRRLFKQDFKEDYGDLIDGLSPAINTGIETLYQVVNKNIDLTYNIQCTVKDVNVEVDSTGKPKSTTSFALDVANTPVKGCQVIQAENLTNSATYPTSQPFISFTQNNNNLILNNVTGLQANQKYRLRVVAWN